MKLILIFFGFVVGSMALADGATWTPRVDFRLEDSDYSQTLIWLSGWSYALTEVARATAAQGSLDGICVAQNKTVESKVLLDALNAKFKGQRITSEQAAPVLYNAAKKNFSCKRK